MAQEEHAKNGGRRSTPETRYLNAGKLCSSRVEKTSKTPELRREYYKQGRMPPQGR